MSIHDLFRDSLVIVLMLTHEVINVFVMAAMLGSAMVAGIFFAFSSFVMKALSRLPGTQGMAAMQMINITVLNRWFLGLFMATATVCFFLAIYTLFQWQQKNSAYIFTGCMFYIIGCLLVTGVFNVPRNKMLAKVELSDKDAESIWLNYVMTWSNWNLIRTIFSLLAMICFMFSIFIE